MGPGRQLIKCVCADALSRVVAHELEPSGDTMWGIARNRRPMHSPATAMPAVLPKKPYGAVQLVARYGGVVQGEAVGEDSGGCLGAEVSNGGLGGGASHGSSPRSLPLPAARLYQATARTASPRLLDTGFDNLPSTPAFRTSW